LTKVVIDPDFALPDVDSSNNKWKTSDGAGSVEVLTDYLGVYSSPVFPMKITVTENSGVLVLEAEGQPTLPLESEGGGEFSMEEAGLSIQFNAEKTGFKLNLGGQEFDLTKE
jgi:hypothetical protein